MSTFAVKQAPKILSGTEGLFPAPSASSSHHSDQLITLVLTPRACLRISLGFCLHESTARVLYLKCTLSFGAVATRLQAPNHLDVRSGSETPQLNSSLQCRLISSFCSSISSFHRVGQFYRQDRLSFQSFSLFHKGSESQNHS